MSMTLLSGTTHLISEYSREQTNTSNVSRKLTSLPKIEHDNIKKDALLAPWIICSPLLSYLNLHGRPFIKGENPINKCLHLFVPSH